METLVAGCLHEILKHLACGQLLFPTAVGATDLGCGRQMKVFTKRSPKFELFLDPSFVILYRDAITMIQTQHNSARRSKNLRSWRLPPADWAVRAAHVVRSDVFILHHDADDTFEDTALSFFQGLSCKVISLSTIARRSQL